MNGYVIKEFTVIVNDDSGWCVLVSGSPKLRNLVRRLCRSRRKHLWKLGNSADRRNSVSVYSAKSAD